MNLLDLPEEILIKILAYCAGDEKKRERSLIKATEVCKYFNDLVGKTPCLVKLLRLKIHVIYGSYHNKVKKSFKYCLRSSRMYASIDIFLDGWLDLLNYDENNYLEKLLEKHAATIKYVTFKIVSRRDGLNKTIMYYLEHLPNIERAEIAYKHLYDKDYNYQKHLKHFQDLVDSSDSDIENEDEETVEPLEKKLKKKEIPEPSVNYVLRFCGPDNKTPKNITFEKLKYLSLYGKIDFSDYELPNTTEWLERVNPEVLEALTLNYSDNEEEISVVLNKVMESSVKLNLKSFELLTRKLEDRQLATLKDFLKTQQNLTKLMLGYNPFRFTGSLSNLLFMDAIVKELPNLTELWVGDLVSLRQGDHAELRRRVNSTKFTQNPKRFYVSRGSIFPVHSPFVPSGGSKNSKSD